MTEEIYQNLVVSIDKDAEESVHLCLWPEYDEGKVDKKLEEEMDLAYTLVKLGRSARSEVNIKNRQPLSKVLISVDTLPKYYGDIVKEELNIKEVELGADLSEYVKFEIKPNLPVLGKEYGKLIPRIKEEIAKFNQMELAIKVKAGEIQYIEIDENQIALSSENLLVTMNGKDGFAFAGEGEIGVILDTNITDQLKEEGYVREIISKVQNLRKDSGFEVEDKIALFVKDNEMLINVIKDNEEQIAKVVLATEINYNKEAQYQEFNINGEKILIALKKQN
jgi:isoleucyl-tRNA synthetase